MVLVVFSIYLKQFSYFVGFRPPSSAPEQGANIRAPSSAPEGVANAQKPPSPAPARRSKKRGPGAIFRNERRRLSRIEPDVLMHETEVEGGDTALPPPHLTHLELRSDKVTPPALQGGLALSDEVGQVQVAAPGPAAPAVRNCRKCKMPTRGHSGPTGLNKCSVSLTSPERLRDSSPSLSLTPSFPSPVREKREEPASTPQSLPPPSPSDVISPTSSTSPYHMVGDPRKFAATF